MKLRSKNDKTKLSKQQHNALWSGVTEKDFNNEVNVEDAEIGEFDKKHMLLFAANTNLFRQIVRLSDSLKPVERRILYSLYKLNCRPGTKTKSAIIVSNTMKFHCHGDSPIYSSFVNLAQPWKRAVPLVSGKGNFGNAANPDLYAHYRYTEGCMSKYAWECFFDDYDEDCVETLFNSSSDSEEPMALPSKFPNILVNGGMGIAFGNSFRIPPYNINDIIDKCKAVLFNPNTVDLFMVPDFPCDCDIIDDGESLQSIIDTGEGSIKMRGRVEIAPYGQHWMLSITSVPWMCNLQSILDRVRTLAKAGEFSIIDIQPADYSVKMPDGSIQTKLDTRIIINKAHDPYVIRDKLYSTTDLEKTVSINFKVVTENLTIEKMNMRDLINSWIDERRSYKRRLYNKRLTKISARIELLSVLIYLLQKDNIEKTVKVIKNSNSSDLENQLMKLCAMSSYQAHKISEMRLSAFTKDARKRYEEERAKLEKEREEVLGIIRSEKKIDKIIASELDDLRKYATPRKTNIIQPTTEKIVSDTTHNVIVTKNGYIKKLHYNNSYSVNMGTFKAGDYPISRTIAHNMDSLIFFDSFGRYSIIPVHDIANNEPSQYGHQLFNTTKLSGTVVGVELYMNDNMIDELNKIGTPYLVTATARGYIKKTPLATYLEMRNTKNVKCMKVRDDDSLVYAGIILENTSILIYTKLGSYVLLDVNSITEQGKDNMGLMSIKMDPEDSLCGVTVIGKEDTDIVILTEKGNMKKCPIGLFGDVTKRTTIGNQYHMATLEVADKINCALGIKKDSGVIICTRTDVFKYDGSEIPEMTKKAKGKKLVSIPLGVTIINVFENPKGK